MKLLEFINEHDNWKELLQQPPYNLIVKEKDDYTLLKYNQLESDFSNEIVKECRGIILNKDNKIVCHPFHKFFNYGEQYADSIDWSTARVLEKIDGCFTRFDTVMLADGTKKSISEIVNKKLSCEVLSYNFQTGQVEPKPVIGWKCLKNSNSVTNETEWVTIYLRRTRQTLSGKLSQHTYLTATKNHSIFVQNFDGSLIEKLAGALTDTDTLVTPGYGLSALEEQLIYGGLLGDASLTYTKKSYTGFSGITFSHSTKQLEYSRYKASLLSHFVIAEDINLNASNYGGNYIRQKTNVDAALNAVRDTCYMNGKKQVTRAWLEKLDWLGFAFWYMDDGYLNKSAKNNSISLSTEGFSKDEVLLIKQYYESLGYTLYVKSYRGYYGLTFSTDSSELIWQKIRSFIPACMQYKLPPRHQGFYDAQLITLYNNDRTLQLHTCYIDHIQDGLHRKSAIGGVRKYDIEVADNHNYFCGGVLVHNSLIKLWQDKDNWMWSTNGNIDADALPLDLDLLTSLKCSAKTWGELIRSSINYSSLDFSKLNKNYTYMFELVSPFTTVVIPYEEVKLYHLATRDNITYKEVEIDIGIEKPKSYSLKTLDDCVKAAEQMDKSHEGFVVVDGNYHRVKIKNPLYLKMHRMANNGNITIRGLLQLIEAGDEDEFLSYFPQYTKEVNLIKSIIETYKFQMQTEYNQVKLFTKGKERKEVALYINNNIKWKDWCFYKLFKNAEIDPAVYLFTVLQGDNLLKMIAKDLKEGEANA